MAEILVRYQLPVRNPNGLQYEARAYGAAIDHVLWEGWIEFVPIGGGRTLRTPRETTQPNRVDTVYWATRSEEHTSELQSLTNLVCRLLLEKKKKQKEQNTNKSTTTSISDR